MNEEEQIKQQDELAENVINTIIAASGPNITSSQLANIKHQLKYTLSKYSIEENEEKEEEKGKTKKIVKTDSPTTMSQNGFAHKYTIVISLLVVTVLVLIVLLILKWTQII